VIRLLCVFDGKWVDADTGEQVDPLVAMEEDGGIICGYELYSEFIDLSPKLKEKGNWKFRLPGRKNKDEKRVRLYFYKATHTRGMSASGKRDGRKWIPSIQWVIWNLEIFNNEPEIGVVGPAKRLRKLCEDSNVKPTATPGGMGKAMLKSMPGWDRDRYFAPPWISELAREHLPGNFYALRENFRRDRGIVLIDQQNAHHNIVNSIPCPLPSSVRRRGARYPGKNKRWISVEGVGKLSRQMGLLRALVEIDTLPLEHSHLYPEWAQRPGRRMEWIWTPELRLLGRSIRLIRVQTAFTGNEPDPALREFSDFALNQRATDPHTIIKPVLHSAYGSLAVSRYREFEQIILGDVGKYRHVEDMKIPFTDETAHAVTIKGLKISTIQNVIAYGVITSEQTVRSLELARTYEWEYGLHVCQVYADALLVRTAQIPFVPNGWEVKADLGEVMAALPNQIISSRLQRIPGLHGERRRAQYVQQVKDAA
jgi:hypothetical protein